MADNYDLMSEVISVSTDEQLDWLFKAFDLLQGYEDEVVPFEDIPDEIVASAMDFGVDLNDHLGLPNYSSTRSPDTDPVTRTIWVHSDESFNVDTLAMILQAFLKRFNLDGGIGIQYAFTCSKPRAGEFGGGAFYVTANDVNYTSTGRWLDEQED